MVTPRWSSSRPGYQYGLYLIPSTEPLSSSPFEMFGATSMFRCSDTPCFTTTLLTAENSHAGSVHLTWSAQCEASCDSSKNSALHGCQRQTLNLPSNMSCRCAMSSMRVSFLEQR